MHPASARLLALWQQPLRALTLAPADWSAVLGAARRARCAGHLMVRLREAGLIPHLPEPVRGQFESVSVLVAERAAQLDRELEALAEALAPLAGEVLLLKGAAYQAQGLALAAGRIAGDVDLLVPRPRLARAETLLLGAGWMAQRLDGYDERYYREWSHELPPLRHPARSVEVDLHHALTPALAGGGIDEAAVLARAVPLGAFRVPDPRDQVLHCAVHAFKDTELDGRLRELMDFDLLVRAHGGPDPAGFSDALIERAIEIGGAPALRWAARYATAWLATPVAGLVEPPGLAARRERRRQWAVPVWRAWWMDRLMGAANLPGAVSRPAMPAQFARLLLQARYHRLRMPPARLLAHLAHKSGAHLRLR
ncbi:MAG: nucleotidyltransferase family protein [Betaproteobacteria bacterium]|nr:nucleotidyltransferase family protein [Betaproteobacteria bacterium]